MVISKNSSTWDNHKDLNNQAKKILYTNYKDQFMVWSNYLVHKEVSNEGP